MVKYFGDYTEELVVKIHSDYNAKKLALGIDDNTKIANRFCVASTEENRAAIAENLATIAEGEAKYKLFYASDEYKAYREYEEAAYDEDCRIRDSLEDVLQNKWRIMLTEKFPEFKSAWFGFNFDFLDLADYKDEKLFYREEKVVEKMMSYNNSKSLAIGIMDAVIGNGLTSFGDADFFDGCFSDTICREEILTCAEQVLGIKGKRAPGLWNKAVPLTKKAWVKHKERLAA